MATLFLDASAILAALDLDDELHEAAKALLANPDVTLATLDLARYEVANVAVRAWRSPDRLLPLLEAIDRIADDGGITLCTSTLLTRAAELAEQHAISVYHAAYAAASLKAGARLVSCDARDLIGKGLASSPADLPAPGSPSCSHGSRGHVARQQ